LIYCKTDGLLAEISIKKLMDGAKAKNFILLIVQKNLTRMDVKM
jgi:hypothetical protein